MTPFRIRTGNDQAAHWPYTSRCYKRGISNIQFLYAADFTFFVTINRF